MHLRKKIIFWVSIFPVRYLIYNSRCCTPDSRKKKRGKWLFFHRIGFLWVCLFVFSGNVSQKEYKCFFSSEKCEFASAGHCSMFRCRGLTCGLWGGQGWHFATQQSNLPTHGQEKGVSNSPSQLFWLTNSHISACHLERSSGPKTRIWSSSSKGKADLSGAPGLSAVFVCNSAGAECVDCISRG